MVEAFEFVDEILWSVIQIKNSLAVRSHGTIFIYLFSMYIVLTFESVDEILCQCDYAVKWNIFSSALTSVVSNI